MAVTVVPIQIRRGNEADFNASKMLPGEFAVSLDQKITRIAFAPGDVAILAKQADLDSLEARIEDVERDASSATDATTTLGNTVSNLSTRVSQAENDIDVLESDVDALETASNKMVKVNAAQNFTTAEKTQARTNIGAASTEDVAGVVKYTAQNLTDAQKTQARSNIGAVSSAEVTGVVKYVEAQTLTDAQKTQVRVNTGTAAASAVAPEFATNKAYAVGDMVTYQGKMYTFKAAHSAGAWNAAHVNETNAGAEISNIKGDLSDKVNVNQGVLYAGKALVIDDSGVVVPGDVGVDVDDTLSIPRKAADAKKVGDEIATTVKFTQQVLTDAQKTQARNNIGIGNSIEKAVRYDVRQGLSETEQENARNNIGIGSAIASALKDPSSLFNDAIKHFLELLFRTALHTSDTSDIIDRFVDALNGRNEIVKSGSKLIIRYSVKDPTVNGVILSFSSGDDDESADVVKVSNKLYIYRTNTNPIKDNETIIFEGV